MELSTRIYKLRQLTKLSQEQFAASLNVARQTVQKWETGKALPDTGSLLQMAKQFGVSMDYLLLGQDKRTAEVTVPDVFAPAYHQLPPWEFYADELPLEFRQWQQEGKDIAPYEGLFMAAAALPNGKQKKQIADVLFQIGMEAPMRSDYPYDEPSDLAGIQALRATAPALPPVQPGSLPDKIHGAWMGRICGCLLGKPVEGMPLAELHRFLKETDNFPMHRYLVSSDASDEICARYDFPLQDRCYADRCTAAPVDDDTNYTAMAQWMIDRYGRQFTPEDVGRTWLNCQPKDAYCTAERVAYKNLVAGYRPPLSACYQNPYREWIGAQIRGDYYGYINPGDPETAAEMAYRDASISHIKNGIYGEMFVAAMLACAAVIHDPMAIIQGGLAQIPATCRLYEKVQQLCRRYEEGADEKDVFKNITRQCPEEDWVHTFPNALIVAAALLYGKGSFSASICLAVQAGYDTDCNGATVGSIVGMMKGFAAIEPVWQKPVGDTLQTTVTGVGELSVSKAAAHTLQHLPEELQQAMKSHTAS